MTEIKIPYLPTAKYFKIVCRLGVNRPDTADDDDRYPNLMTQGGRVEIAASIPRFRYTEADGKVRLVSVPRDSYMIQSATGELFDADGVVGVYLLNTSSPGVDPAGFTYKATVRPAIGEPFEVTIPGDPSATELDLNSLISIAPSAGVAAVDSRLTVLENAVAALPTAGQSSFPIQRKTLTSNWAVDPSALGWPTNQVVTLIIDHPNGYEASYAGTNLALEPSPATTTITEWFSLPGGGWKVSYPTRQPTTGTTAGVDETALLAAYEAAMNG